MGQYINGEEVLIANQKEMPPRISDAILAINADAKFTIINDNVDRLEWLENFTPISKEDIKMYYSILVFSQGTGIQELILVHKLEDENAAEIMKRIVESIELRKVVK